VTNIIQKKCGCTGLRILKLGRRQIEVWFCPRGATIPDHVHSDVDVTLVILAGCMRGKIGTRIGQVGWNDMFRRFLIKSGTVHSAVITGAFCLFASFETWRHGSKVTSAAMDFSET
jgi:mannose-6-phosphate isomerase-like protein (cupin superfamily)